MEPQLALGIDLGGTNLRAGIVSQTGELLEFASRPIDARLNGEGIIDAITTIVDHFNQLDQVVGVGVALAGAVIPNGTIRKELTNLPGLDNFPLDERLSSTLDKPCRMDNDAILALLGECRFGAGKGYHNVLLLTLGTGIGGGLLLNGELRRGSHGMGCEVGMLPFPHPDIHNLSPFERLASPKSIMEQLGDPNGMLYERARAGDQLAQNAIDRMYRLLGWLVTNVHISLDLELVILSGGLASVGKPLQEGVTKAYHQICPTELQFELRIELGMLPVNSAGVIGAACLFI